MPQLLASSVKNCVILKFAGFNTADSFTLERRKNNDAWVQVAVGVNGNYTDYDVADGIYQYRCFNDPPKVYFSHCVVCGVGEPYGYTFRNYKVPDGEWGEVVTVDDMRLTYLWGTDFRASNGTPFTDAQTRFFIDSAVAEMERRLNITIKKTKCVTKAKERGVTDYDVDEAYYEYNQSQVQRNGRIYTRKRPVLSVENLQLLSRNRVILSMDENTYTLDENKGAIKYFNRPFRASDSNRAVMNSIYPYGADQYGNNLFYVVDYTAGYENSDKVPADLRAAIGKMAAIELLNTIGDGLMAGFSSSSLSMDGMSESFSSTQSATSAYFGARIKVYEDEIDNYINSMKMKFGHIQMGVL